MTLMQQLLLYGVAGLAALLLADVGLYLWRNSGDRGTQRIKRRLGGQATAGPYGGSQLRKKQGASTHSFFLDQYLSGAIEKADSTLELRRVYWLVAILSVLWFLALNLFLSFLPALLLAPVMGLLVVAAFFHMQIQKRRARFEEQFPDAIDLVVRNLRVGRPLNAAIRAVAEEMPAPVGKEFHLVAHDITYGKSVPDAIKGMLRRIPTANVRFFVLAVQIQHESGGNLAEILEGLSKIVRGRFRLVRKVRALTAEGRFSAWFLSIFPVVMILAMNTLNPGYYEKVSDYPFFKPLIVATAIMLCMNVVAMRVITKLKL